MKFLQSGSWLSRSPYARSDCNNIFPVLGLAGRHFRKQNDLQVRGVVLTPYPSQLHGASLATASHVGRFMIGGAIACSPRPAAASSFAQLACLECSAQLAWRAERAEAFPSLGGGLRSGLSPDAGDFGGPPKWVCFFGQSAAELDGPQAGQVLKSWQPSAVGPLETAWAANVPERHNNVPIPLDLADAVSIPSNTDTEQPTRGLPGCPLLWTTW